MDQQLLQATGISGFNQPFAHSEELFHYAVEEFTQRGFEEASINQILINAGMSKGQFYYYFKNKEGLYLALIARMIQAKRQHTGSLLTRLPLSGDFYEQLRSMFSIGMDFARNHPQIDRFGVAFLRERGRPIYHRALEIFSIQNDAVINALIQRAIASGEIRENLPPQFVVGLVGLVLSNTTQLGALTATDDLEVIADNLVSFLREGLAPVGPAARINSQARTLNMKEQ